MNWKYKVTDISYDDDCMKMTVKPRLWYYIWIEISTPIIHWWKE